MARIRFSNSSAPASDRASISRAERPFEILHLPALELGERELDARASVALGAIDLLVHGVLVLTQSLVELVDRPAAVVHLSGELFECTRECVLRTRLELVAQAHGRCALLVDRAVQLLRLGGDLCLDVRDALAHPLLQGRNGALQCVLGTLEVGLPRAQPLLDALLYGRNQLRHALGQLALAYGELAAALVGEAALLGDVRGERVGLRACNRDTELLRLRRRLFL